MMVVLFDYAFDPLRLQRFPWKQLPNTAINLFPDVVYIFQYEIKLFSWIAAPAT